VNISKIITYVVSCSSELELDARRLYVWGGIKAARYNPENRREMERRIEICQAENKCQICDAEIHKITLKRTKKTFKHLTG